MVIFRTRFEALDEKWSFLVILVGLKNGQKIDHFRAGSGVGTIFIFSFSSFSLFRFFYFYFSGVGRPCRGLFGGGVEKMSARMAKNWPKWPIFDQKGSRHPRKICIFLGYRISCRIPGKSKLILKSTWIFQVENLKPDIREKSSIFLGSVIFKLRLEIPG